MFKFLRSQAKVFYWVIAATFILFLFLGGMTTRGCNAPGTRRAEPGVVGYVNGERITSQQYQNAVAMQLNQMQQQGQAREIDANQRALAQQQAWDSLVYQTLFMQEIRARGLTATDEEILAVFRDSPPPELLGRVIAASRTLAWLGLPVGAAIGGLIAGKVGVVPVYVGGSLLVLGIATFLLGTALVRDPVMADPSDDENPLPATGGI